MIRRASLRDPERYDIRAGRLRRTAARHRQKHRERGPPGYTAQEVQFADTLAASVAAGSGLLGSSALTPAESLEPTRLNGNNVDLASETTQQISANLKFQFASQAAQQQFSSMRAAMEV
ncbi:hypothetical protein Lxx06300 [Leifsonia xyli subsp. xyli str. CTCB07]|uniref:Uncharacterized protein n=1 Tax=Leifsonia xyli subsp. xyli (strain CTCB07) TaxID=281090 RepID=Q6AGB1_LEIXX|nr:hypothetical protein Lxx06300 [Leifsonia xyli subsp. xyli str. CTCB07]